MRARNILKRLSETISVIPIDIEMTNDKEDVREFKAGTKADIGVFHKDGKVIITVKSKGYSAEMSYDNDILALDDGWHI